MRDGDDGVQRWLERFLREQGAVAGTVHLHDPAADSLVMQAAVNIPPKVRSVTEQVPRGKGMAGLALERERPVSICDLQDGASRDVRPGARAVEARAAVALPIRGPVGIRAVVGVAYAGECEFTAEQLDALVRAASSLP